MFQRSAFFNKLLLFFILIGVIPLGVLTFLGYALSTQILEKSLYQETSSNLRKLTSDIDGLFFEYSNLIQLLSEDPTLKQVLSDEISLQEAHNSIYEKIYFLTLSKTYVFPLYILDEEGSDLFGTAPMASKHVEDFSASWGIFKQLKGGNGDIFIISESFVDTQGNSIIFTMGKRITDGSGETLGYILVNITREAVISIINSFSLSVIDNIIISDQFYYIVLNIKNSKAEGSFYRGDFIHKVETSDHDEFYYKYGKNLLAYHRSRNAPFQVFATIPLESIDNNLGYIKKLIILSLIISGLLAISVSFFMARNIVKPIKVLVRGMKRVEEGDYSPTMNLQRNDEIGLLEDSYNNMVIKLQESIDTLVAKQRQLREAEIKILQAQINPHFLYNTLDAVKWMAKLKKFDEITTIVTQLGTLLRNSIDNNREFLTVRENLEIVNSYIRIQSIRSNEQFSVVYKIDEGVYEYQTPKLMLQPLVENAIIHGLMHGDIGGVLVIEAWVDSNNLIFVVQDNGVGMSSDQLHQVLNQSGSDHIGLCNVDHRIKLYYGVEYGLSVESKIGEGTRVTIKIPKIRPSILGGDS